MQLTKRFFQVRVQAPVDCVEFAVPAVLLGMWLQQLPDPYHALCPCYHIGKQARSHGGQDGCPQQSSFGHPGHCHREAGDVGLQLIPHHTSGLSTADAQFVHLRTSLGQPFRQMSGRKGYRFKHRARQMVTRMTQCQSEEDPSGLLVPDGRALPSQVWQK